MYIYMYVYVIKNIYMFYREYSVFLVMVHLIAYKMSLKTMYWSDMMEILICVFGQLLAFVVLVRFCHAVTMLYITMYHPDFKTKTVGFSLLSFGDLKSSLSPQASLAALTHR